MPAGLTRNAFDERFDADLLILENAIEAEQLARVDHMEATFFVMKLAARLGLDVPPVQIRFVPDPLYLIERFDRQTVGADKRKIADRLFLRFKTYKRLPKLASRLFSARWLKASAATPTVAGNPKKPFLWIDGREARVCSDGDGVIAD